MKKLDKRAELLKKQQAELDRRTQVENEVVQLIRNCEFEKANALLETLDDNAVKQIGKELDELKAEKADILVEGMVIEQSRKGGIGSRKALGRYMEAMA